MNRPEIRQWRAGSADTKEDLDLAGLLVLVACGDHQAFERVYGQLAGPVYGLVRQVLRDPAQSEEIARSRGCSAWPSAR